MKKAVRKYLSVFLAVAMLVTTLLPMGAYAAKITAAVVNDNTVLFFIIIPSFFILNPIDRKL